MNLPNSLSLTRIFLVPLLVVILLTKLQGNEILCAAVFLLAALTDLLDGYLARRRRQITPLGQLLDPIADKLLIAAAFISLVEIHKAPAWMVVVILGREYAVTALRHIAAAQGRAVPSSDLGKSKMVAEVATITILILGQDVLGQLEVLGTIGLWVVLGLALVSGSQYFFRFRRELEPQLTPVAPASGAASSRHEVA
jgi:CDP-diacylglycerol--glycerol-3-phosphate 3-phosphatidyltransferase